jgi:ribonuclease P protein component
MLPRSRRLTRATFPDTRTAYRAVSPHFSLSWGPAKAGGAAAIVSKKVAKRSVDRHLLKRRMLAVVASYASPSRFLIAYARAGSPALSFTLVKQELTSLLARIT